MKEQIKKIFMVALILGSLYGCEKHAKRVAKIEASRPFADSTIELESNPPPYFWNANGYPDRGLFLTLEERANRKRLVNFYDHGFDGNLNCVKISQKNRRDYITTNSQELVRWQPIFEEKRNLRFGKFE